MSSSSPRSATQTSSAPAVTGSPMLAILNAEKEITPPMCQTIYINAIQALRRTEESSDPLVASGYLRELFQTQRCDAPRMGGADLSTVRADVVRSLGENVTKRLVEPRGGATQEDLVEGFHTVQHYATWHRRQLLASMDLQTRAKFYCQVEVEKTAAVVMSVAAIFGVSKVVGPKVVGAWRSYFPPTSLDSQGYRDPCRALQWQQK